MSDIDHKAQAEMLLDIESKTNNTELARDAAKSAHAHASLYAAEQTAALVQAQRTANLIAYVALIDAQFAEAQKCPEPWDMSSYGESNARRERAQKLVREELGL